jgi:hypothetical protein
VELDCGLGFRITMKCILKLFISILRKQTHGSTDMQQCPLTVLLSVTKYLGNTLQLLFNHGTFQEMTGITIVEVCIQGKPTMNLIGGGWKATIKR